MLAAGFGGGGVVWWAWVLAGQGHRGLGGRGDFFFLVFFSFGGGGLGCGRMGVYGLWRTLLVHFVTGGEWGGMERGVLLSWLAGGRKVGSGELGYGDYVDLHGGRTRRVGSGKAGGGGARWGGGGGSKPFFLLMIPVWFLDTLLFLRHGFC